MEVLKMYFATAGGGCAAFCGGSPVKLPGFETVFEIFVHALKSTSEKRPVSFQYREVTVDFSIQYSASHKKNSKMYLLYK